MILMVENLSSRFFSTPVFRLIQLPHSPRRLYFSSVKVSSCSVKEVFFYSHIKVQFLCQYVKFH